MLAAPSDGSKLCCRSRDRFCGRRHRSRWSCQWIAIVGLPIESTAGTLDVAEAAQQTLLSLIATASPSPAAWGALPLHYVLFEARNGAGCHMLIGDDSVPESHRKSCAHVSDSGASRRGASKQARQWCLPDGRHVEVELSQCCCIFRRLRRKYKRHCVLFVQHRFKNEVSAGVLSGSFVACAESFGNCDVATEGGIPRSSR